MGYGWLRNSKAIRVLGLLLEMLGIKIVLRVHLIELRTLDRVNCVVHTAATKIVPTAEYIHSNV